MGRRLGWWPTPWVGAGCEAERRARRPTGSGFGLANPNPNPKPKPKPKPATPRLGSVYPSFEPVRKEIGQPPLDLYDPFGFSKKRPPPGPFTPVTSCHTPHTPHPSPAPLTLHPTPHTPPLLSPLSPLTPLTANRTPEQKERGLLVEINNGRAASTPSPPPQHTHSPRPTRRHLPPTPLPPPRRFHPHRLHPHRPAACSCARPYGLC